MENKKIPEGLLRAMEAAILADEDAPDYAKAAVRFSTMMRALHKKIDEFFVVAREKVEAADAAWFEEACEYFKLVRVGLDQFLAQSRGGS